MERVLRVGAVVVAVGLVVAVVALWAFAPWWVAAMATVTGGAPAVFLVVVARPMLRRK